MIIIRKAIPVDALELKKLHVKTYQISYRNYMPDDYLDNLQITKENVDKFSDYIKNSLVFVAEEDCIIKGFINTTPQNDDILEINAIYIDPDYQKQHIGTLLIDTVLKDNPKYKKCILWTMKYGPSREFYHKMGFQPTLNEQKWKFDIELIMLEKSLI
ncbi:MAG: GNAT family N-acetyltransferase [Alphaproteobacteria bacterium]|nr:GNAT family N-acetyltransferase [Alphaproteobacteria bacterium]